MKNVTARRTAPWSSIPALALTLLALTTSALAQNAAPTNTSNTPRIQPMSQETSTTAFFYQKPTVLDREQHKGLRLKAADARFAAKNQAVPLLAAEFPEACLEYPIVFTQGQDGQWLALALTGLQANVNAFVDAKGLWNARYVPASVRRYPFILAESANQQLSLAADLAAPQLGTEGEALFDDKGEPAELAKNVLQMLADFQNQAAATAALAKQLHEAGLLTQQNLQVRQGEEHSAVVEGVWIVDEAKLRQLPDEKVLAWFKGGQLAAIHAHMLSLRNLVPLLERSRPGNTDTAQDKPGKKAKGG
ncbi:SapC family protein [Limnohabitans sp.]|uniref:SapC family protein n=1 Tax=Limnohabitans sp. TaxID=1907725 RepID=UPI0031FCBD23